MASTSSPIIDDPTHWHDYANELRKMVQRVSDPELRQSLLHVAECYEVLARRAERLARLVPGKRE